LDLLVKGDYVGLRLNTDSPGVGSYNTLNVDHLAGKTTKNSRGLKFSSVPRFKNVLFHSTNNLQTTIANAQ
jgi:hypothetical protein